MASVGMRTVNRWGTATTSAAAAAAAKAAAAATPSATAKAAAAGSASAEVKRYKAGQETETDDNPRRRVDRRPTMRADVHIASLTKPSERKVKRKQTLVLRKPVEVEEVPKVVTTATEMIELSRFYGVSIDEVKEFHKEFEALNKSNTGELTREEFNTYVLRRRQMSPEDEMADLVLQKAWIKADVDRSGTLSFEEFLLWSLGAANTEELAVQDKRELQMRQLARELGLTLMDVEKVQDVFKRFDANGDGTIDHLEFRQALITLMNIKNESDLSQSRVLRWWYEVDADRNGRVCFSEFVVWYFSLRGATKF